MIQAEKIAEITGAKILSFHSDILLQHLLLDSRKIITPNLSLFFAIKGIRHDGHAFLPMLYNKGVRHFIVEEKAGINPQNFPEANIWEVASATSALQKIVSAHRKNFNIPIIGITGSNGKTIVKEWLSQLLNKEFRIVKNPKSYNSQIGVPLSVWEINKHHTLGIFEAGISLPNEMQNLEKIIQPNIGILTNIGPPHDEGFKNRKEKTTEKLNLFKNTEVVFFRKEYPEVESGLATLPCKKFSWSTKEKADFQIIDIQKTNIHAEINFTYLERSHKIIIPFSDEASIENCIHCICVLLYFNYSLIDIQQRLYTLLPIAMRLELKEGLNGSFIIDDTYNNDLSGLTMALNFLDQKKQRSKKTIILSDLLESGMDDQQLYSQIENMLLEKGVSHLVGIGKIIVQNKNCFKKVKTTFYETTEEFLEQLKPKDFSEQLILIKGARVFAFERIVHALQQKVHGTVLEINLDALAHNLNFYRAQLKQGTKVMVMVKAFAYGSGSFEVANLLQFQRADYLAVAYADEGVALRENGITLPIMVMNPSTQSFDTLIKYQLEPELYSISIAQDFITYLEQFNKKSTVHIKVDTGMRRLGFEENDLPILLEKIISCPNIKIASIFTHLAAADDEIHYDFTIEQLQKFKKMAEYIETRIGYTTIRHALNSAGIIRFPEEQMDMVRLGIGLYGVEANGLRQNELQTVGTLKTIISQLKKVNKGDSIGYSRKGRAERDTTVATIAIGYADGYDRGFSNGVGKVIINGKRCPIIGNVCMDMCMVDVTNVDVKEGDTVTIFGPTLSIIELAASIGTIPYEIITGVSERVKRVFFAE